MRKVAVASQIVMWLVFIVSFLFQGGAILSILMNGSTYNVLPLCVAVMLMLTSLVLFYAVRKKRIAAFLLSLAVGVALIVIALDLQRAFPAQISSTGSDTGLDTWKMLYRHMSMSLIPLLMLPAWLCGKAADTAEALAEASHERPHFDLSGDVLFSDGEAVGKRRVLNTLGMEVDELEQTSLPPTDKSKNIHQGSKSGKRMKTASSIETNRKK